MGSRTGIGCGVVVQEMELDQVSSEELVLVVEGLNKFAAGDDALNLLPL